MPSPDWVIVFGIDCDHKNMVYVLNQASSCTKMRKHGLVYGLNHGSTSIKWGIVFYGLNQASSCTTIRKHGLVYGLNHDSAGLKWDSIVYDLNQASNGIK